MTVPINHNFLVRESYPVELAKQEYSKLGNFNTNYKILNTAQIIHKNLIKEKILQEKADFIGKGFLPSIWYFIRLVAENI